MRCRQAPSQRRIATATRRRPAPRRSESGGGHSGWGSAYEVIPMRMNSIAFVTFMAVAMIAGAAEAGKHSGIKTTNGIANYRAGGNPISIRKPPVPKVGRTVRLRRGVVGTFKWP